MARFAIPAAATARRTPRCTAVTSLLFAIPIWEPDAGGFPALNGAGSFLIKDVALLGLSLIVLGESLARISGGGPAIAA